MKWSFNLNRYELQNKKYDDKFLKEIVWRNFMSIVLSRVTLGSLPDNVSRPQYKYNDLEPGIIHIGYGNFHRASIRKQMQKST